MTDFEDRDMKIAGVAEQDDSSTGDAAAHAFKLQLENGNIEKTKLLGDLLAEKILPQISGFSPQKVILVRFCITNFVTVRLADETLTHIVIDRFENALDDAFGTATEDDTASEMYSLFLLAARERINVAEHIARTYAGFCDDKEAAVDEAMKLYDFCDRLVASLVKQLNFVGICLL